MKRSVDLQKLKPGTVVDSPVLALRWTHHGVNAREASLGARLAKALVRRERELGSYPGQRILTETKKAFIYKDSWSVRAGLQCSSFLENYWCRCLTSLQAVTDC